jgi:FixJ family two-component response regulator
MHNSRLPRPAVPKTASCDWEDDDAARSAVDGLLRARIPASVADMLRVAGDALGCLIQDALLPSLGAPGFQIHVTRRGDASPIIVMNGYWNIKMTLCPVKAGARDVRPKVFRDQGLLDVDSIAIAQHRHRRLMRRSAAMARKSLPP